MRILSVVLFVFAGLWAALVYVYVAWLVPYACAFGSARGSCSESMFAQMNAGELLVFALLSGGPFVLLVGLAILLWRRADRARR